MTLKELLWVLHQVRQQGKRTFIEHLLCTRHYHFTYIIQFILPSTLKKNIVVFDLRGLTGIVTGQRTIHSVRSNDAKEQAQN